ncbi:HNH endonuclease [Streptomyces sp. XM83C]|jgi:5-methylcytosine-specific restriction endonuclease McrA|uniref:HNH endonuclease n=1 Tax=Streptomyces thermocoprophilus TaxID=78356 RepID=A0ABV5VDX3_9ACTN|nr:HNH endonuclease [Streptomyces sp. XM83C]MCK1822512.1 HNH endonuclease [Streptomyces sp. XM83C]
MTSLFRRRIHAYLAEEDRLARANRRCLTCGSGIAFDRDGNYCREACFPDPAAPRPPFVGRSRRSRINGFLNAAQARAIPGALFQEIDPLDVLDEENWICHLCQRPIPDDVDRFDALAATVDHVMPLARGGDHIRGNMRAAHRLCNTRKNDRLP